MADLKQPIPKPMLFMHRAPVGMAETDLQGEIRQLNPKAVQLMMPMAMYQGLSGGNLLATLVEFLPQVRETIDQFTADSGMIINQEPYQIMFNMGQSVIERCFSLTIEKVDSDSLLIFFDDVTDFLVKANNIRKRL